MALFSVISGAVSNGHHSQPPDVLYCCRCRSRSDLLSRSAHRFVKRIITARILGRQPHRSDCSACHYRCNSPDRTNCQYGADQKYDPTQFSGTWSMAILSACSESTCRLVRKRFCRAYRKQSLSNASCLWRCLLYTSDAADE